MSTNTNQFGNAVVNGFRYSYIAFQSGTSYYSVLFHSYSDNNLYKVTCYSGTVTTVTYAKSSDKGILVAGDVTFSDGAGTATINGIKSGARIIAGRRQSMPTSIILTAICNSDNVVSFSAYDTSGDGGSFTGTLSGIVVAYDNT